jgi:ATP-dependent Clp protease ATP-binding subunit ClpA
MNWLKSFWKRLTTPQSRPSVFVPHWSPVNPHREESPSNFTPHAQQVLALSRREADRFNHYFVGTEHLLLGIVALGQGIGAEALKNMGIDLALIRNEIERSVGIGPDQKIIGSIPFTPRVKKVLALAAKQARALNDNYVGTEHLLLGLLCEADGVGARVLLNLNVNIEKARAAILKVRETSPQSAENLETTASDAPAACWKLDPPHSLTPRAQRVMTLAREAAEQTKQPTIGTEHVLWGLVQLGKGGVATNVLNNDGVNSDTVAAQLKNVAGNLPQEKSETSADDEGLARQALSFVAQEARALSHTYIGTEHLLLALLHQEAGGAAEIFKNLEVDCSKMRKEILKELSPLFTSITPSTSTRNPASSNPISAKVASNPVDVSLRYDVYCREQNQGAIVYRNALFKSIRSLLQQREHDAFSQFIELELSNGETLFIARTSVVRFCQHGVKAEPESHSGEKE